MSKMKLLILLLLFIGLVSSVSSQNVGSEVIPEPNDYYLDIDKKEASFKDIDADSVIVNVSSNMQWRIEESDRWITTKYITDTSFSIKTTQNLAGYRTGSVRVVGSTSTGASMFTSVKVEQSIAVPSDFSAVIDANDENNVVLSWSKYNWLPGKGDSIYYEVYRDSVLIATTLDTFFVEEKTMLAGEFYYNVSAVQKTAAGVVTKSSFSPKGIVHIKNPLIVTANNVFRYVGFSNPDVSAQYSISGFVSNDDITYLSKRPTATIDPLKYHMSIPINTYSNAIEVSGGEDNTGKYRFMYVYANLVVIPLSNDADLSNVIVDGIRTSTVPEYYAIDCTNMKYEIDIVVNPDHNYATINLISDNNTAHISGNTITVNTSKPSKQEVVFEIVAQDGVTSTKHRIVVERYFSFYDIVINRWDIALTAINNPVNNGGYNFLTYKWYCDGQLVGTSQSYSMEEKISGIFYLEVTTDQGEVLRTCEERISLNSNTVKVYPNPVVSGQTVYIETDFAEELLKGAVIEIYNLSGVKVKTEKVAGKVTEVTLDGASGTYLFKLKGQNGLVKDLKIIRK